ncbi:MAG: hypothetical protein PHD21_05840 [Flavobacteriales bacterium]|nr:hypothetical protein [Flavobacteriales bacterium]
MIIVSDLEAAYQIMEYKDSIPNHIPVVIVSELEQVDTTMTDNIFYLHFSPDIEKTFRTAQKMFPNFKNVYVWSDKTTTGEYYLDQARSQLKPYQNEYTIEYGIDAMTDKDFITKSSQISSNSFVILCTWQQGDDKKYYDPILTYPKIAKATDAPIFAVIDNVLQCGFLGGYTNSPYQNGKQAAKKAIEIWDNGMKNVSHFQNITNVPIYNDKALRHWHANRKVLPEDAHIIYSWKSVVKDNMLWIVIIGCIILASVSVMLLLLRFRRAIMRKNAVLHKYVEQRNALMKKLEKQYEELNALKNNQEMALDIEGVSIWWYDVYGQ